MKNLSPGKLLLYGLVLAAMTLSGLQLGQPAKVRAETGCCTFGEQCTTKAAPKCCLPYGEAPCSEAQQNYCKKSCVP